MLGVERGLPRLLHPQSSLLVGLLPLAVEAVDLLPLVGSGGGTPPPPLFVLSFSAACATRPRMGLASTGTSFALQLRAVVAGMLGHAGPGTLSGAAAAAAAAAAAGVVEGQTTTPAPQALQRRRPLPPPLQGLPPRQSPPHPPRSPRRPPRRRGPAPLRRRMKRATGCFPIFSAGSAMAALFTTSPASPSAPCALSGPATPRRGTWATT